VQLEIFQLHDGKLELDGARVRPKALYAMDLSHVNEAVLGADVFERQKAVIDYGSRSLFLKDA
jgi:hypothetical protein